MPADEGNVMSLARNSLVILLAVTITQFGCKQKCTLSVEQSPAIRGIRLGMTEAQITALLRQPLSQDLHGEDRFDINYKLRRILGGSPSLNGISNIELNFLDDKLYFIRVYYQNNGEWRDSAQFLRTIAPQLGLPPPEEWDDAGGNDYPRIECNGVQVLAGVSRIRGYGGDDIVTVQITNLEAKRDEERRRFNADVLRNTNRQENERQGFRP